MPLIELDIIIKSNINCNSNYKFNLNPLLKIYIAKFYNNNSFYVKKYNGIII